MNQYMDYGVTLSPAIHWSSWSTSNNEGGDRDSFLQRNTIVDYMKLQDYEFTDDRS